MIDETGTRQFTEIEKKVLTMMFSIVKEMLRLQNGWADIDYQIFNEGDLFNLAEKLGVEDY